jgi:V/A-type H+-transporting ATPase subunit I
MLRPRPARWFEVLAARDDATLVLEALARTGTVELEARTSASLPAVLGDVLPLLAQYAELVTRYHAYWPSPQTCRPSAFPEPPVATLHRCLSTIRAWAADAEPLIRSLQRAEAERDELRLWQRVLPALASDALLSAQWTDAGPWLGVRLFVLPSDVAADEAFMTTGALAPEAVASNVLVGGRVHLLVTGRPEALQTIAQTVTSLKGSVHDVPDWLRADTARDQTLVARRLTAIESEIQHAHDALAALHQRHDLSRALGDADRLQWVLHNVHALEADERLCWITGWSSDASGDSLQQALQASRARALWRFAPPPVNCRAPLLFSNPRWARPFEIFSRALGMPGASEADPSQLLAVVVPLIFGYMFGDVGQGLMLAVGGWWLRKRGPVARLLMIGGMSAMAFGFVFGSVFGMHALVPALWRHALESPLPVLLAPLVGGAVLLTLGLALGALEAGWRGQWRSWLLTDAGLVIVYLGLLAAFVAPVGWTVAIVGAVWCCIGSAWEAREIAAGLRAIGELLEKTLQILINTLSFARVGAFALAHAGLASAIVALMNAADSILAKALVLVVGNAVVIVLEAMVVSIQTTRLVLFEFFTRFMQAQGRAFRPLPPPPSVVQETLL